MPKQKKSLQLIKSLEELISDHDRDQLVRALATVEHDLSWQVLRAAMMKEYLSTVSYALDNCSKTGSQIEAAYQAGVSQCLYDMANSLIPKYKDVLQRKALVTEQSRPEE
jgi:hypothetical protein